ncbi:MAG TPA: aldose 1-epimerase [Verrucomicrobiae bacterium]|jgi:aldose 1-epimerase|nr:aldose 1-epimerase [Verrucomicrobiae bacterium]
MPETERQLSAGDMQAVFRPSQGMLGVSLRHRGVELLRRLENLEAAAEKGSTAGIPLLYPWANRLAQSGFEVFGRKVSLNMKSPLLHGDEHGLPIHGIKWDALPWDEVSCEPARLVGRLEWNRPEWLSIFPFKHAVEMTVSLEPDSLTIETTVLAEELMPVSFGFHPYFGLPKTPRAQWRLKVPAMLQLELDNQYIPTGQEKPFPQNDFVLGDSHLDAGFRVLESQPKFSLSDGERQITVHFLENFPYAVLFAPKDKDFVAIEPMTAPTAALNRGNFQTIQPSSTFRTRFQIRVK